MKYKFLAALVLTGFAAVLAAGPKTVVLPFEMDLSKPQIGLEAWGNAKDGKIVCPEGKYCFSGIVLPASEKDVMVECDVSGTDGATLGACLFDFSTGRAEKIFQRFVWGKNLKAEPENFRWGIPAANLKGVTTILFYNVAKKGSVSIETLKVEAADAE